MDLHKYLQKNYRLAYARLLGTDSLADPAAGANILIDTGNSCLSVVGVLGQDGAGPAHGSTGLSDGLWGHGMKTCASGCFSFSLCAFLIAPAQRTLLQ